jgi:hypothetical protein
MKTSSIVCASFVVLALSSTASIAKPGGEIDVSSPSLGERADTVNLQPSTITRGQGGTTPFGTRAEQNCAAGPAKDNGSLSTYRTTDSASPSVACKKLPGKMKSGTIPN